MNRPKFLPGMVCFTGIDESTRLADMVELSQKYPIVWAVLYSNSPPEQEARRYWTNMESLADFAREARSYGLNLAVHLCGDSARRTSAVPKALRDIIGKYVGLVQFNMPPKVAQVQDWAELNAWCQAARVHAIRQCRAEHFPDDTMFTHLYDKSGGRGALPSNFIDQESQRLVGYAGGISPDTIEKTMDMLSHVKAHCYYLDMETGIRDLDRDTFDLDKCRAVCEAIWQRETFPNEKACTTSVFYVLAEDTPKLNTFAHKTCEVVSADDETAFEPIGQRVDPDHEEPTSAAFLEHAKKLSAPKRETIAWPGEQTTWYNDGEELMVYGFSNVDSASSKFPPTVLLSGENNKLWAIPLDQFWKEMKPKLSVPDMMEKLATLQRDAALNIDTIEKYHAFAEALYKITQEAMVLLNTPDSASKTLRVTDVTRAFRSLQKRKL